MHLCLSGWKEPLLETDLRAEAHFPFSGTIPVLPAHLHFPWLPLSPVPGGLLELSLGHLQFSSLSQRGFNLSVRNESAY